MTRGSGETKGEAPCKSTVDRRAIQITTDSPILSDVVVVGAGLSGLTTAYRLRQRGYSVTVLEADDRVGGRIVNLELGDGIVSEGGGEWIGSLHTEMHALIEELGLSTFSTHTTGKTLYAYGDNRQEFDGAIPPMRLLALLDFGQAQYRLELLAKRVPASAPWLAKKAFDLDSSTLGGWLDENCHTSEARHTFETVFELMFAENTRHISLLKALHQIVTSGGLKFMMNTVGGAQETRVVGGTQLITDRLAEEVNGCLILDSPVTSIEQTSEHVMVRSAQTNVAADHVVVAMTPADADRIRFEPRLPTRRSRLQRAWRNGAERKVCAVYEEPFWRARGLNGMALTDLPASRYVVDNSPPDGSLGILTGFIGADPSVAGKILDDPASRRDAFVDELEVLFGPDARNIKDYKEKSWIDAPWISGVAGIRTPGVFTSFTDAAVASVDRVHWAGAEASVEFESYMEGAVRSALRAVSEIDGR